MHSKPPSVSLQNLNTLSLKECEVFGVSSDEYRTYAEKNRAEWEKKGQEVVEAMVEEIQNEYDSVEV